MTFYDRFIELCKERQVSPSFVMKEIGLNKSNATFWKKGSIPKGKTLQKLSDYFGVSVDCLLGVSNEWLTHAHKIHDEFQDRMLDVGGITRTLEAIINGKYPYIITQTEVDKLINALNEVTSYSSNVFSPESIESTLSKLNEIGKKKVANYAQDLTEIPRYRLQNAPDASEGPQTTQKVTDTTPPENAPEGPQEPSEEDNTNGN